MPGRRIDFFKVALDGEMPVFIFVFRDVVAVETTVFRLSAGRDIHLGDVHDLTAVVLALVCKDHKRKRLTRLAERHLHAKLKSSLAQECDSAVRRLTGTGVNGCHNGMSRKRGFHGGVCLGIADFSDRHNVGIESECRNHQFFLRNVVSTVVTRSGKRMHDIILYLSEAVPLDKKQLACAGFDGVDTLVIGNAPEQCVQKRCFTRRGSTRDHKADAVSDAHFEEFHDFLGCHSAVNEALAVHTLWVQETNGNGNAAILIHNGTLDRRNTGIAGQVSLRDRHGVVDNNAAVVQKALDDIDRMTGRVEVFFGFDYSAVRVPYYLSLLVRAMFILCYKGFCHNIIIQRAVGKNVGMLIKSFRHKTLL